MGVRFFTCFGVGSFQEFPDSDQSPSTLSIVPCVGRDQNYCLQMSAASGTEWVDITKQQYQTGLYILQGGAYISFYLKVVALPSTGYHGILCVRTGAPIYYGISLNSSGTLTFYDSTTDRGTSVRTLTEGGWHLVEMSVVPGGNPTRQVKVDGEVWITSSVLLPTLNCQSFRIGRWNTSGGATCTYQISEVVARDDLLEAPTYTILELPLKSTGTYTEFHDVVGGDALSAVTEHPPDNDVSYLFTHQGGGPARTDRQSYFLKPASELGIQEPIDCVAAISMLRCVSGLSDFSDARCGILYRGGELKTNSFKNSTYTTVPIYIPLTEFPWTSSMLDSTEPEGIADFPYVGYNQYVRLTHVSFYVLSGLPLLPPTMAGPKACSVTMEGEFSLGGLDGGRVLAHLWGSGVIRGIQRQVIAMPASTEVVDVSMDGKAPYVFLTVKGNRPFRVSIGGYSGSDMIPCRGILTGLLQSSTLSVRNETSVVDSTIIALVGTRQ